MNENENHEKGADDNNETEATSTAPFNCHQCRKSKLKCDRTRPCCSRCANQGYECVYSTSRQPYKSRNRGQAKEMEAKLDRLERLLQNSQTTKALYTYKKQHKSEPLSVASITPPKDQNDEIVRLGLFEEIPPREFIETLMDIYFNDIHQAAPMLHRQRFMACLFLPGNTKPPMCLQYIIMAFAAETSDLYRHMGMAFYKRARSYLQAHDMDDITQTSISIGHAQAWALTSCFEAEHTMFAKASITLCSAIRVAQMLNLHQVDVVQHDENHLVDSIEMEERRRTWWTIFCFDRFVCATTGWPALIHDHNIKTRLPASDEAYAYGREEHARFLGDQLTDAEPHSSFAGRVLTAHIFHRTIEHNSDNSQGKETQDFINDAYWKRHNAIDNDLKFMLLMLPKSLCLPANYRNHNAVFVNTMLHTATICLHRAALWKMKSNLQGLPSYMIRLSQDRLIPAAEEILNIFRMIPNLNTTFANPLICFSAYMAALVFLSSTTPTQPDSQSEENLNFILKIMAAFCDNNLVANAVANEIVKEMKQCGIVSATMDKLNLQNTPIDIPLLATQRLYSSF